MIKKKEIFEKKEITIEQVMSAVSFSKTPAPGEIIYVKRAGAVKTLPIQYIINRLRAEHPDTRFMFGDEPKAPSSPTDQ